MSTIQITKKWSGISGGFKPDLHAWVEVEVYQITNCPDVTHARAAMTGTDGATFFSPAIPIKLNDTFAAFTSMRCTDQQFREVGFNFWECTVTWTIPFGGDATSNDNPLMQPIKITWEPGSWSEPSEIDAEGYPIVNMAGDPCDPQQLEKPTAQLVVKKYVPYYDLVTAVKYQGAINCDTFTIAGPVVSIIVPPGQCRCRGIKPEHNYTINSTFCEITARFDFRPNNTEYSNVPGDAWDLRILNQGFHGWYSDGAGGYNKGKLLRPLGEDSSRPFLLDQSGLPIETGVTIAGGNAPIANPTDLTSNPVAIESQTIGTGTPVTVYFLHYLRGVWLPFTGLV